MCGRYQFSMEENLELRQIVQSIQRRSHPDDTLNFPMAGDVTPAASAPVLVARHGKIQAELQRWGLPGTRGGLVINARAETVCHKPMFRRSIAAQRCAVPASGYYEWDAGRHKFLFTLPGQALYLAGIYDHIGDICCFVILTTEPNDSVRPVHHRMPLVLTHRQVRPWLTDPQAAVALLGQTPPALQRICQDGQLGMGDLLDSL